MKKRTVQNQSNIKMNNCKLVLNIIRDNQDALISRADIVKITKMSPTSITRIADQLMEFGLVQQAESVVNGSVGRNGIRLKVIDDAILTAGISIDSDYINICILNFRDLITAGKQIKLRKRPYQPEEIVKIAHAAFVELCLESGYEIKKIMAVGISCIGNVDYETGTIYFAPQFQWENVEIGRLAEELFDQPVFVDNDMKASLVGLAHRHRDIKHEDVTYLSIGTGVGSAVMYGGALVRGSNNAAGEVGHVILESSGRHCDCGQTGCVQTYLTKNSLIEQCQEEGHLITEVEQIYDSFRAREEWAVSFVDRQARHPAMLLRNLVYMYNTRYILVGGAIISDFPEFFHLASEKMRELMHENLFAGLTLELVKEKNNSTTGAAFMAQEYYIESLLFEEEQN